MNINTLKYFLKVAELQHLSKAAEQLYVAQPSLSRTISSLEEELGVKLFDRIGKNIYLNSYGEIVLRHAKKIVSETEDITKEIQDYNENKNKELTIVMHAATTLIGDLVSRFKKKHPEIILNIIQSQADNINYDVKIYSTIEKSNKDDILLLKENILLGLPNKHPLINQPSIDLREHPELNFVVLQKGFAIRSITDKFCSMANFSPKIVMECDSPSMLRSLLRAGQGVSFIPEITWKGFERDKVILKPLVFPNRKRYIYLSLSESQYVSSSTSLFIDFVIRYFKSLDTSNPTDN